MGCGSSRTGERRDDGGGVPRRSRSTANADKEIVVEVEWPDRLHRHPTVVRMDVTSMATESMMVLADGPVYPSLSDVLMTLSLRAPGAAVEEQAVWSSDGSVCTHSIVSVGGVRPSPPAAWAVKVNGTPIAFATRATEPIPPPATVSLAVVDSGG